MMTHGRRHLGRSLAIALAVVSSIGVTTASAFRVPGGKFALTDCYGEFEVDGAASAPSPPHAVQCTDGDPTCDFDGTCNNSCEFHVGFCLNQTDQEPTCTPQASLKKIVMKALAKKVGLQPPALDSSACGASANVTVPVKVRKNGKKAPGKRRMSVLAIAPAKPKIDRSALNMICNPCGGGTTTTTIPGPPSCPKNPAGGPDQVNITFLGSGTDLDSGWTGTSFNFPQVKDTKVSFCVSDCTAPDAASPNPTCTINAPTGPGSLNSDKLGPPLPLIAGGVAVCVVNRFQTQGPNGITGSFRLDTGEAQGQANLFSDVFVTDGARVCPRCENGTCDSGTRRNQSCTVDGSVTVVNSVATNKLFHLSRDCQPLGQPVSSLNIPLTLTTGTVGTPGSGGSKPCHENEANGVNVQDDNCGAAGCGSDNCTGNSCVQKIDDPSMPGHQICVDVKGGLSQNCCNSQTFVPCFPTRPGGPGIVRTGRATPASPPWPDPSYPKTGTVVQVSTFCVAATGNPNVDGVTGLPGPGAVVINAQAEVLKSP